MVSPSVDAGGQGGLSGVAWFERDCLEYALCDDQLQGVWGGTSDRERARFASSCELAAFLSRSFPPALGTVR